MNTERKHGWKVKAIIARLSKGPADTREIGRIIEVDGRRAYTHIKQVADQGIIKKVSSGAIGRYGRASTWALA